MGGAPSRLVGEGEEGGKFSTTRRIVLTPEGPSPLFEEEATIKDVTLVAKIPSNFTVEAVKAFLKVRPSLNYSIINSSKQWAWPRST